MVTDPDRGELCRSCGAPVTWAHHATTGKPAPLQVATKSEAVAGSFSVLELGGRVLYRIASPGDPGDRYVSHFAHCLQADDWRVVPVQAHHRVVRRTNPDTSREAAAAAVPAAGTLRARVLALLMAARKPLTDDELVERHARIYPSQPASPSGIRTRRSELERAGLVACVDSDGRSAGGKRARRYSVTKAGADEHQRHTTGGPE